MEQPSYYATIPANVRYDKELRPNEKLLYGEITTLTKKTNECWASNNYFADLYEVTPQAVSKWVSHLEQRGYIKTKLIYKENGKEIEKRIICLVSTNVDGVSTKDEEGYQQKIKENNTSNNNIYNPPIIPPGGLAREKEQGSSIQREIENLDIADSLKEALKDFSEMRKKIRKPLTEKALELTIKKLNTIAPTDEEKIQVLEQSIMNSWQGVFPIKENYQRKPNNEQAEIEKLKREAAAEWFGDESFD